MNLNFYPFDPAINYSLQFKPNGFVVLMDLIRKYIRVHSASVAKLFHDWVLVKPNYFAGIRQLAEERSKSFKLFSVKFEIGALGLQHVPHSNAF